MPKGSTSTTAADEGTQGEGTSQGVTSDDPDPGSSSGSPSPVLDVLVTLDGAEEPAALTTQGVHRLVAEVAGGNASVVDFFDGEVLIGSDTDAPFELEIAITSVDSGLKVLGAVAVVDGAPAGQDVLEVSVNVAGGNLDAIKRGVLSGAVWPAGISVVGGGLAVHEGRIYLGASSGDGTGELISFIPELEEQWRRSFTNGVRAAPAGLGEEEIGVASLQGGNWVVQVASTVDGETVDSWILGPAPSVEADFGPRLAQVVGGLLASTSVDSTEVFALDGMAVAGSTVDLEYGVITGMTTSVSRDVVFLAFGDAFESEDSSCATSSEFCAAAVAADGTLEWVTGLTEETSGVHHLAAARAGGAFSAASGLESSDASYALLRIGSNGVVENSAAHGYVAGITDDANDNVSSVSSPETAGGVVVCGANGPIVEDGGLVSSPFVAYYDDELEPVWEIRDFVTNPLGAYIVGCATSSTHVFVYGIEGQSVEEVGGAPAAVGDGWIARIGL